MSRFLFVSSLLAGCTAQIGGPQDVFDSSALSQYSMGDRAFVEGHALGVLYFSRTVPKYTQGTGFTYKVGLSAPHAQVSYDWTKVIPDANGAVSTSTSAAGGCNEGLGGCGSGSGSGSGSGDGGGDGSCQTFLDPARAEATSLIANIDLEQVMGPDYAGQTAQYAQRFQDGVSQALDSEDAADNDPGVEFGPVRDQAIADNMCTHSPLVLDVDGAGIVTSSVETGVAFDLLGNGRAVRTAWPSQGALLVLDRDGDGRITSGRELFGNGDGAADGFGSLAAFDDNHDGVIDARDAVFGKLALWRDTNHDGISSFVELTSLAQNGVTAIPLAHDVSSERDAAGNVLHDRGRFVRADGSSGDVIDVWFRYGQLR